MKSQIIHGCFELMLWFAVAFLFASMSNKTYLQLLTRPQVLSQFAFICLGMACVIFLWHPNYHTKTQRDRFMGNLYEKHYWVVREWLTIYRIFQPKHMKQTMRASTNFLLFSVILSWSCTFYVVFIHKGDNYQSRRN